MIQTFIHNCGVNNAVGLKGCEGEVIQEYYKYYNYGATSGEIQWLIEPTFAYFWSTPDRLLKACYNILEMRFNLGKNMELQESHFKNKIKEDARKMFEAFERKDFIRAEEMNAEVFELGQFEGLTV
jgi:hypothetical protein